MACMRSVVEYLLLNPACSLGWFSSSFINVQGREGAKKGWKEGGNKGRKWGSEREWAGVGEGNKRTLTDFSMNIKAYIE